MTTSKIQVTAEQAEKLIANLRALPDTPVGEHLSDDEFVGYAMEALDPPEIERLDTHLASCMECVGEMERLVEAAEGWDEERLALLRERALAARWDAPDEPSARRIASGTLHATLRRTISSLLIGWQVPVASVAGILVGVALTLLMPRLTEQAGIQTPGPTEQTRGQTKGGQAAGECELSLDITALPAAEEWLKRIAEAVVQGRVDEAVKQLEDFRCYYPDYKQSASSVSPQPETQ